jgi:mannose-6-phosphate isomerase-like protein (cupin superfamily)
MGTSGDINLQCPDLGKALAEYTGELGFRLDMIFPADSPRQARLSGHGITLTLESGPAPANDETQTAVSGVMIRRSADAWVEGRAGMQYRDLIAGRLGGRFIASHIRIPTGGPVADYVHHHHIRFQMIYCYRGWVRVVYEDQGESFVMRAGDCVLQPPHIRHQVLESSDGMEVIEIGCPAEHETLVDHELELPIPGLNRDRVFDGQKFVFHKCSEASWLPSPESGFEARDTGISAATDQLASAVVLRPIRDGEVSLQSGGKELHFLFVLSGSMTLQTPGGCENPLRAGDCFTVPADTHFTLSKLSADLELLRVHVTGENLQ